MITNLTDISDRWLYQSNRLIESSYTLTVLEQKLLRILASIIKKDDEDFKEYQFKAKDLMQLLNIKNKRFYKDIDDLTDLLMQRIIKIKDKKTGEFIKYHWVDVAKYGDGILYLKINPNLKLFYLSLDWYTKYQLKNVLQFKSTYSFRFYELLKQYEKLKERTISVENLRTILDIEKNQYPKYANLKQKVIKVAICEINTKTDLNINFEEIKKGRRVYSIKFLIEGKNNKNENFDDKDIDKVKDMFKGDISTLNAIKLLNVSNGNLDLIKEKYNLSLEYSGINNLVSWLISAIKGNYTKDTSKIDSFNNFEQRTYDFGELERKLLGWD